MPPSESKGAFLFVPIDDEPTRPGNRSGFFYALRKERMHEKAASIATGAAYVASGTTTAVGLTINDMVAIGGLLVGLATFLVNWYYRHQHLQLAKEQQGQE